MPLMSGVANLKTYSFSIRSNGSLLYIAKDSLVFVNVSGNAENRGLIYWDKDFKTHSIFGSAFSFDSPVGFNIGSFVPAGVTIQYSNFGSVGTVYLYVIELDNDEPNA